ncbi:zinc finger CCHC domain-containing protein 7 isoform X2 [Rhinatrema bivittatum]|nr:zinc finger CCHC domain-containing protein 7 isoform X2 [Rhinatrema bivittatum]XP_029458792.1 zinc finger CCHC domain-containing protein 7 isoform X2 [Rhinatrema bivittatum]XP_029458801.1 zinc finger CCHC domain-containing protein 7 isoform X2 [Rhinatrema bivittatum]XP_029458811.1 zinc finger CCHC domain-containing protein 7 isoform X2 [Rhinatrema bivittatum]XP_029458817.1 zinc finger CCHC domain-containing protein 7 isoform X2 [Rhinatrema bivittatum]XP_029458826.1 zinc finger CCHC domain-c
MMFGGYEDIEAYEDDLYREDSSSEQSVDSEVECQLYSQIHYSQDLADITGQEEETLPLVDGQSLNSNLKSDKEKEEEEKSLIILSDSDVVQISDGSEVIILSDSQEEDSVYSAKDKKLVTSSWTKGTGHTTPNNVKTIGHLDIKDIKGQSHQRGADKSIADTSSKSTKIHQILIIEESSATEDRASSVSESECSDVVENWMLLGSGKEDGDKSIQLNIEGCGTSVDEEGERGVDWSIGDKDLEAQIGNCVPQRRANRYYTVDKNIICRNCDKRGHLSKNCSASRKLPACCLCGSRGHTKSSCPARYCSNCFLPGHFSVECIEKAYWKKRCHRCSMTGHYADACPEIWRQYHLTVNARHLKKSRCPPRRRQATVYCYNCAKKGHLGYECSENRMFSGNFPASPFIYTYDREHDITKRLQRVKNKVEELQEAGLLPRAVKRSCKETEKKMHLSKNKQKNLLKESKKGIKKEQQHYADKKKTWKERHREKKHKKQLFPSSHDMEEDFPRGNTVHSHAGSSRFPTKHYDPILHTRGKKVQHAVELLEAAKRKERKKQKSKRDRSPYADESLFLIKQRRKKSKKNFNY